MILTALILLALLVWLWQDTQQARERAILTARRTCDAQHLQLLDGTVSLQRLRPSRCNGGRFCLRRTFVFEYSTSGNDRQQGFVLMNGPAVTMVGLAPEV
jgi:hypothetical protein